MITSSPTPRPAAPPFPVAIPTHWTARAREVGFDLVARVQDRFHVLLACQTCGHTHASKVYNLMTARPTCPQCMEARWRADAAAVGATFLHRADDDRHRGVYRLPCGHELARQFGQIKRAAAGLTGIQCEHCLADREAAEAGASGWTRLGAHPDGRVGYRHYRHGCGHQQTFTARNMLTGRIGCAGCGQGWWREHSFLYQIELQDPSGRKLQKVGMSRNPTSRMKFQLGLADSAQARLIRTVRFRTGRAALTAEKRLHSRLRHEHPSAVIPRTALNGWIKVTSEIYDATIGDVIERAFDQLELDRKEADHGR